MYVCLCHCVDKLYIIHNIIICSTYLCGVCMHCICTIYSNVYVRTYYIYNMYNIVVYVQVHV